MVRRSVACLGLPPKDRLTVEVGAGMLPSMSLEAADAAQVRRMRALAHPVRLRILSLLTASDLSAAEIARELGISQANASYHVRALAKVGHIREVGVESVRGGRAKKYRYRGEDDATADHVGPPSAPRDQVALVDAVVTELRRRVIRRQQGRPATFTDAELWVDPEVWAEVVQQVHEASTRLHHQARPPRTEGTIPVSMVAYLFAMEEDSK